MALEKRIEALKQKHARIDQMLREEELRHGADQFAINRLKSMKLGLKDEIAKLSQGQRVAA